MGTDITELAVTPQGRPDELLPSHPRIDLRLTLFGLLSLKGKAKVVLTRDRASREPLFL